MTEKKYMIISTFGNVYVKNKTFSECASILDISFFKRKVNIKNDSFERYYKKKDSEEYFFIEPYEVEKKNGKKLPSEYKVYDESKNKKGDKCVIDKDYNILYTGTAWNCLAYIDESGLYNRPDIKIETMDNVNRMKVHKTRIDYAKENV